MWREGGKREGKKKRKGGNGFFHFKSHFVQSQMTMFQDALSLSLRRILDSGAKFNGSLSLPLSVFLTSSYQFFSLCSQPYALMLFWHQAVSEYISHLTHFEQRKQFCYHYFSLPISASEHATMRGLVTLLKNKCPYICAQTSYMCIHECLNQTAGPTAVIFFSIQPCNSF